MSPRVSDPVPPPGPERGNPSRVGVVVPIRSLVEGKVRLAPSLSTEERRELVAAMAATVIRAAHELPVLVVHDDPAVAGWARELGADTAVPPAPGLNAAADFGRARLAAGGTEAVVIAHADLPRATDLRPVAAFDGITLVPDRIGDGTNVLCLPARIDFTFAYGPGSFEAHRRAALATGLPVRVLEDPDLAWDIDHPDDLAGLAALGHARGRA